MDDKDTSAFDEAAFRERLIEGGIPAEEAAETARRTAEGRSNKPQAATKAKRAPLAPKMPAEGDLFTPSAEAPGASSQLDRLPSGILVPKTVRKLLDDKIVDASTEIASNPPSSSEMAFMHAIMCQVGLPRSRVGHKDSATGKWVDVFEFERQCGNAALSLSAGKLWDGAKFVQQPIPYGTLPRLMLAWMNTYAVRYQTPEVAVGNSASDFLRLLGKDTSGGEKGTFTMFRKQIQALSACQMTLGFNAAGRAYTYDGKPIRQFQAWLAKSDDQPALWPGVVTFSDEYYKTLISHAVPLDIRALSVLKGSALAMDVYTWLADRLHRIDGRPVLLHWANIRNQFGQEYQGKDPDKDFKKKFVPALRDALAVYPKAKVKRVTGGLLLLPSPPPIPYKGS